MTRGRKGWEQVTGPGRNCAFGGHYQPIALHLIILILKLSERRTRLLLDLRHRSGSCSASIPAKEPLTPAYIGCLFLHRFKWTHEFFPFHPKFNTYLESPVHAAACEVAISVGSAGRACFTRRVLSLQPHSPSCAVSSRSPPLW